MSGRFPASKRTFSGLKSLCTIPSAWARPSARASVRPSAIVSSIPSGPFSIRARSVPPGRNGMTR